MTLIEITDVRPAERATERVRSFALDSPRSGDSADADRLQVEGWILGRDVPVKAVHVVTAGGPIGRLPVEQPRTDVAGHFPDAPSAERSGFRGMIRVAEVPPIFQLHVRAVLANGLETHVATIHGRCRSADSADGAPSGARPGRPGQRGQPPPASPNDAWPRLQCDAPPEGAPLVPGQIVAGWVFSPVGINEVSVWVEGRRVGQTVPNVERPDVAAVYPDWPAAPGSGFSCAVADLPATSNPRLTECVIVAVDWLGRRAEVRRPVRLGHLPAPPVAGSLDIPKAHAPEDPLRETGWSSPLVVYGWAVDPHGIERVEILLDGRVVAHAELDLPREDVQVLRPEYREFGLATSPGWLAVVPTDGIQPGRHELRAVLHGRSATLVLGAKPVWLRAESVQADPARQQRLEAVLRCPSCGGGLRRDGPGLACADCRRPVPTTQFHTYLCDETYAELDWRDALTTSHGYPPDAAKVITDCQGGLVLDIGAGLRENIPHVIQLDAIAYPTTDVAANAQAMPFPDETFDGVVACNLLEHVSSPLDVVREIRRVCKVGGCVYADFTSVHPYHGFPHHYFNATETGLEWLMREVGGAHGTVGGDAPQVAVWLVLEGWLGSLDDPATRRFVRGTTVADLLHIIGSPESDPDRYAELGRTIPEAHRLIPPKVMFAGVRVR